VSFEKTKRRISEQLKSEILLDFYYACAEGSAINL